MLITQLRRTIASRFGRNENNFALILGFYLLAFNLFAFSFWSAGALLLWTIYYLSHRLEKLIYGKVGFR